MQIKMHIINNSILYKKIKNAEIFISAFFIWLRYIIIVLSSKKRIFANIDFKRWMRTK